MKTVFEATPYQVAAAQILTAAEEVTKTLPADLQKFAVRKIKAARKAGTLRAAYKAGRDIEFMASKPARARR